MSNVNNYYKLGQVHVKYTVFHKHELQRIEKDILSVHDSSNYSPVRLTMATQHSF